ncbi:MAG TPA: Spy/CpxP family protein refolding chaperone [Thermoanaerobaculia bacterium]|nr:Spy/CpxP family protein refolding chaperone [Thermoanaerobaculia bacterium]
MNRSKVLILCALCLLVPALLLAAANAAGPAAEPGQHGGFLKHIAAKLDLTADQTTTIQGIFANHKADLTAQGTALMNARTALFDAIHADAVNEDAIRAAAQNVGKAEADLAVTRAKIHEEVSQVLTPDQQTKAKALLQKARTMAQRHANHMFSHITGDPLQAH